MKKYKFFKFKLSYFSRDHGWEAETVKEKLTELQKKGLVIAMDNGAFTRVHHEDVQVQVIICSGFYVKIKK